MRFHYTKENAHASRNGDSLIILIQARSGRNARRRRRRQRQRLEAPNRIMCQRAHKFMPTLQSASRSWLSERRRLQTKSMSCYCCTALTLIHNGSFMCVLPIVLKVFCRSSLFPSSFSRARSPRTQLRHTNTFAAYILASFWSVCGFQFTRTHFRQTRQS